MKPALAMSFTGRDAEAHNSSHDLDDESSLGGISLIGADKLIRYYTIFYMRSERTHDG